MRSKGAISSLYRLKKMPYRCRHDGAIAKVALSVCRQADTGVLLRYPHSGRKQVKRYDWKLFFVCLWKWICWPVYFIVGSAIVLRLALLVSYWLARTTQSGATNDNLSGWVQAVGAVLAITAGFTATVWEFSRQRSKAFLAENESASAALLLAHDTLDAITDRLDAALTPDLELKDMALRGATTAELIATIRQFDMALIPSAMLPDFIRLRSHVAAVNARLSEIYDSEKAADYTGSIRTRAERHRRLGSAVKKRNDAINFYRNLETIAFDKYKLQAYPLTVFNKLTNYK